MAANIISQDSAIGSNTGQGPTTDQFSYSQEPKAQGSCNSQVDPAPRSHSTNNFETSVRASGQDRQVPEYGPYRTMPRPITSEVKLCETVGASWRNAKPNVHSHAVPQAPPFPMPSYFPKPQYGMSRNVLIQFFVAFLII